MTTEENLLFARMMTITITVTTIMMTSTAAAVADVSTMRLTDVDEVSSCSSFSSLTNKRYQVKQFVGYAYTLLLKPYKIIFFVHW